MNTETKQKTKNLLSINDLTITELELILAKSLALKAKPEAKILASESLALIFEKPSLRTRVSFELAMLELGGRALILRPDEIQMGKREETKDVAAYISRNLTVAALRVFKHTTLEEFAEHATIPVINALSDTEHPCQALADMLTILEHKQRVAGLKIAYLGDGNNVCHSLMLAATMLGASVAIGHPKGYQPDTKILADAVEYAAANNAYCITTNSAEEAVEDADVVYTDVWASMGQEEETAKRKKDFEGFQINSKLMALAPNAIVLHCLPAHRGEEISASVIDGHQSVVFDQAENRRHAQKAALLYVLGLI